MSGNTSRGWKKREAQRRGIVDEPSMFEPPTSGAPQWGGGLTAMWLGGRAFRHMCGANWEPFEPPIWWDGAGLSHHGRYVRRLAALPLQGYARAHRVATDFLPHPLVF